MTYDHSNKIGNKGDLIKHLALTIAVREMAKSRHSFTYLDIHSGRSEYDLPSTGEWRTGIGEFSEYCQNHKSLTPDLRYFCDVQSLDDIRQTKKYYGSSKIILNVLHNLDIEQIKPILCDTNPSVCKDLQFQFQYVPSAEICCTDGYAKGYEVDSVDLVFIDPPDIREHYAPLLKLARHYLPQGNQFISWNPLHGNAPQQTMSRNCLSVYELAKREKIPSITARWTNGWSGQMCGCQMLFSIPNGHKVVNACKALIKLMGWKTIEEEQHFPTKEVMTEDSGPT